MFWAVLLPVSAVLLPATLRAQQAEALSSGQQPVLQLPGRQTPAPPPPLPENLTWRGPITELYRELRAAALNPAKVVQVREASLDRGELHLYLTDGTIAFTQDVQGRVTGAFFVGEGEVLMRPPDLTERASLGLFSGLGVLNERFSAAYLRSNEDLLRELTPFLREGENAASFYSEHDGQARELAAMDALRLLESLTEDEALAAEEHFLHARLLTRLGSLDVYYDALAEDQFKVARLSHSDDTLYFDSWMSFAGAAAQREPDRVLEPARSSSAVSIEQFSLDTELSPPESLTASADLDVSVKQGGQRLLTFELSRWLQVRRVEVDGREAEFLQNDALNGSELERIGNDLVTVAMPDVLRPEERHHLRFEYSGNVMQQAAPGLLYVGARGTWYPNRGIQMSRFRLRFRWPSSWTLVATGERTSLREAHGVSEGEWTLAERVPLAGFNLGRFARATARSSNVEVSSYSAGIVEHASGPEAPERAAAVNQAIAARSAAAIEKYSRWFGPFPFRNLAVTQLPGTISQGWPTLVYLASNAYLSPEERRTLHLDEFDRLLYDGFMQDHETAHQWWGDRVGWSGYRDQWLMEALANLSAWMILEENNPRDARILLEFYRQALLKTNTNGRRFADAGPVTLGYRLSSSVFPNAYIPVTYGRGLWLLCMLRDYFADAERQAGTPPNDGGAFLHALREFGRRYERRTASTGDFRRVLEEFLPVKATFEGRRTLDWFFEEWVSGSSIPRISLQNLRLNRGMAAFDLLQQECAGSLITPVPVYAELADGKRIDLGRVFADGAASHHTLPTPPGTRRLLIDPEHQLLRLD